MTYWTHPTSKCDLARVLQLNQAAIPAVNSLSLTELFELFAGACYFQNLCADQRIVGFLIALAPGSTYQSVNYRWFHERYRHFLYIDRIVIDPRYQRAGYGRILYDELKEFAVRRFPRLACEVNLRPKNEVSLIFHERYGFQQVGTLKTEDGEKEVSLMEYQLDTGIVSLTNNYR